MDHAGRRPVRIQSFIDKIIDLTVWFLKGFQLLQDKQRDERGFLTKTLKGQFLYIFIMKPIDKIDVCFRSENL